MTDLSVKAVSLDELSQRVRQEFYKFVNPSHDVNPTAEYWVVDIYTDSLVCSERSGEYYRVPYTVTGSDVQFAPKDQWESVEKEWVATNYPQASSDAMKHFNIAKPDELVFVGGEVKALGNGKVGGYLVQYSTQNDPDLTRDYFDTTSDLDIENGERLSVYYDHGKDNTLKNRKIGRATAEYRDAGLWLEAQLELRDQYEQYIYKMAEAGKLGWSSGPAQHLIRKEPVGKSFHITHWPIKEASLTPVPAEARNTAVTLKSLPNFDIEEALKSLINSPSADDAQPEAQATVTGDEPVSSAVSTPETVPAEVKSHTDNSTLESDKMSESQTPPVVSDSFEAQMKAMSDQLGNITKFLDNLPMSQNPGYVSGDGGAADPQIKSMGDFFTAVRRQDVKRLETVYESKALTEDIGGSGGYLIPDEYQNRLLQVAAQNSQIVAQLQNIPVTSPTGKIPALDMFFTPTAGDGQTAFAGGLNPSVLAEGGAYGSSDPNVELVEWRIGKVGFKTTVSNELMSDSPISMEALLTRLAGVAIGAKTEMYVLRGNGVNVPLGIINAPCTVGQAAASSNTFAYVDASNMISRHLATSNKVFWLMHKSTIPDITKFEVGTGGAVWIANVSAGMGNMPLLGYPIIFSEHLPKADNSGHVILADLDAYLLFTKGNMTVAYSEHADFGNGNVVWRFDRRLDGQPWMKSAITDANPQGSYTTSPFVQFTN